MIARCAALALALLLTGCGYSTSLGLAPDYASIGIELFGNDSPERDIERELHEALVRKTRELVDASLVAPERARLVMRGKVQEYRRRGGIRSSNNVQLESGLTIRIEGELYDSRAQDVVAGPVTANTQVGYTLDERAVNEAEARARAIENLAQRLVIDLVSRVQPPGADE